MYVDVCSRKNKAAGTMQKMNLGCVELSLVCRPVLLKSIDKIAIFCSEGCNGRAQRLPCRA